MDINIKTTKKKIILYILIINLIILAFGYFIRNQSIINNIFEPISFSIFALSVLFGTIVSIFRINLIESTMSKSVDMGQEGAKNFARIQYVLRYFITGLALMVVVLVPFLDLITSFVCIITLQPASYLVGLSLKNDEINKEITKKEKRPSIWDEMK